MSRPGRRLGLGGVLVAAVGLGLGPLAAAPPAAGAARGDPLGQAQQRVEQARLEAGAVAHQYFAQLDRYQTLGTEVAGLQRAIDDAEGRARALRATVRRRAVEAYKEGTNGLALALDAGDVERVSRATKLLDVANARDDEVVAQLRSVRQDLEARRDRLRATRGAQAVALDRLGTAKRRLDANLRIALSDQAGVAARLAAEAGQEAAARKAATAASPGSSSSGRGVPVAPPPGPTVPPPGYAPRPGLNPHHDDPFLVCTRARESGGSYGAVNPAGPYLGAYQFLQSTWNVAAAHAGRPDLVGVPANLASPYDQDDVAWALYQWQGNGPWGGRC